MVDGSAGRGCSCLYVPALGCCLLFRFRGGWNGWVLETFREVLKMTRLSVDSPLNHASEGNFEDILPVQGSVDSE